MYKMFWMQKDHIKDGSKIVSDFHHNLIKNFEIEDIYGENYEDLNYVEEKFKNADRNTIVFIVQIWHKKHYEFIKLAEKYGLKVWVIVHTHTFYNELVPMVCESDSDFIPTDGYMLTKYLYPFYVDRVITFNTYDYNYYKLIGCKNVVNIPQVLTDFDESYMYPEKNDEKYVLSISSINNYKHSYLQLYLFIQFCKDNPNSKLKYKILTQTKNLPEKFAKLASTCKNVEIIHDIFGYDKYNLIYNASALIHFGNLETGPLTYLEAKIMNTPVICFKNYSTDVRPDTFDGCINEDDIENDFISKLEIIDRSDKFVTKRCNEDFFRENKFNTEFVSKVLNNPHFSDNNLQVNPETLAQINYSVYKIQNKIISAYPKGLRVQ